jgi:TFIIF-interacting CTD phosphatase-like protein
MNKKLNLILDLDETLIFSIYEDISREQLMLLNGCNLSFNLEENKLNFSCIPIPYKNYYFKKSYNKYYVFIRPYLIYFLISLSKYYNIILYTNATKTYTYIIIKFINDLINKFNKVDNIFKIIYYRNSNFINEKDLNRLYIYDNSINITNSIIIDDNKNAWNKYYNEIIYEIPKFNIYNDNFKLDNILHILHDDLILFYNNKIFNKNLKYTLLNFN